MTTTESYGCDKHGEDAYQGCAMCDLETLRERLHEAELVAASWKREAELNEQAANESSAYAKRLAEETERGNYWFDQHYACENELKRVRAQLADTEALIHEAVELLRMWVIWDSMADDAKLPHQKTDTFLLLRRAADHRESERDKA